MSKSVAPHAGAWIETRPLQKMRDVRSVAPHAGAWIETRSRQKVGLLVRVAPHAGAWIETLCPASGWSRKKMSHPTRVRGLKPGLGHRAGAVPCVAPHAGAWIETRSTTPLPTASRGRTPRGCVD